MNLEKPQASDGGELWFPLVGAQIVLFFALHGLLFKDWWAATIIGSLLAACLLPRIYTLPIAIALAFVFGFFYPHWFVFGLVGVALAIIYFLRPLTIPFILALGMMWGLFGSTIGAYLENDVIKLVCGLAALLIGAWFNIRLAGMKKVEEGTKPINIINEKVGYYCSFLILPLVGVVVYEVFMRKALNMPTTWAFDMTNYIYGAHFMMGLGYCMLYDRHVRIDIIAQQFPSKVQMYLKVITFWVLFVPYVLALAYGSTEFAVEAWEMWERGQNTWRPPVFLVKTVMPFAAAILLWQGFSNFVNDWKQLRGAK